MTEQQQKEFEKVTRPVIKWLCDNGHPHMTIFINPISAALYEGEIAYTTEDYLKD